MRSLLLTAGILGSETLLAHPGHGMPGWAHPHVADYALIGFGIFVLVLGGHFLRKALRK